MCTCTLSPSLSLSLSCYSLANNIMYTMMIGCVCVCVFLLMMCLYGLPWCCPPLPLPSPPILSPLLSSSLLPSPPLLSPPLSSPLPSSTFNIMQIITVPCTAAVYSNCCFSSLQENDYICHILKKLSEFQTFDSPSLRLVGGRERERGGGGGGKQTG